jgi:hypothetical protein
MPAIPLAIGYDRGAREDLGGHVTLATVRVVWHQTIHDHHDLRLARHSLGNRP